MTRTVKVKLEAEVAGYTARMKEAQRATEDFSKRAGSSFRRNGAEWEKLSRGMLIGGAALAAGLALAGKAAVDWESDWAGVVKTTNGSPAQMAELETGLRNLAKTLPASHKEIAGVAEAAGQLGVKRKDVLGFTKTMIDLGVSTNLSADEASTGIAQISNVMGTMARDGSKGIERFGSTLVALGNNGASTEADILHMAQRMTGAAKLVGLSESDLLAYSSAMSSVGISAEAGGSAISRVWQKMYADVKSGGEGLENFAKVAGVSAEDYAKAFKKDPAKATQMFVAGLGRIKAGGGDVVSTLKDLGIRSVRETSTLLQLSGAGDLLTDSLKLGSKAWKDNSALAKEAGTRYKTTASQIKVAKNNLHDAAIDLGEVMLPVLGKAAEGASALAGWLSNLPGPVQTAIALIGSAGAAALLAGGAFIKVSRMSGELRRTFDTVGISMRHLGELSPRTASGVSKVGRSMKSIAKGAAIAGGILLVAQAIDGMGTATENAGRSLPKLEQDLLNASTGAIDLDASFKNLQIHWDTDKSLSFADALKKVTSGASDVAGNVLNVANTTGQAGTAAEAAKRRFAGLGETLAKMVSSGDADAAAATFREMEKAARKQGVSTEELLKLMPAYADELTKLETKRLKAMRGDEGHANATRDLVEAQKSAIGSTRKTGDASEKASPKVHDLAKKTEEAQKKAKKAGEAIDKLADAISALGGNARSAIRANGDFEQAIDDVDAQVRKARRGVKGYSRGLDQNTKAGRDNKELLVSLSEKTLDKVGSDIKAKKSQDGVNRTMGRGRKAFIDAAIALDNSKSSDDKKRKRAGALADQLGLTKDSVQRLIDKQKVLDKTDAHPKTTIDFDGPLAAIKRVQKGLDGMRDKDVDVKVNYQAGKYKAGGLTLQRATGGPVARAGGGPVSGPGTGTSDSIAAYNTNSGQPYALSNNEHVWTARETASVGGHGEMARLRKAALAGRVEYRAGGGPVGSQSSVNFNLNAGLDDFISKTARGAAMKMFDRVGGVAALFGQAVGNGRLAALAIKAGFPASQAAIASAIGMAESGGKSGATHRNSNGTTDFGLMQINSIHRAILKSGNWANPLDNMRMALKVWKEAGGSWRPWSTYNNGAYTKYMGGGAGIGALGQFAAGQGSSSGMGWRRMERIVRGAFPRAIFSSAYRPGAVTATGRKSMHGLGRAIDIAGSGGLKSAVFEWLRSHFPSSRELIYSPKNSRQLLYGRNHFYPQPTRSMHYSHTHWGYAKGTKSARPGYAWVGEDGPELLKFRGNEKVWTAQQSRSAYKQSRTVPFRSQPTAAAPSQAQSDSPSGPMRIEGTLDLGNGLTGVVRGVIADAAVAGGIAY